MKLWKNKLIKKTYKIKKKSTKRIRIKLNRKKKHKDDEIEKKMIKNKIKCK
jgi:hypothetical protein